MPAEIPTSFGQGRFVVEKELGRGSMGIVYQTLDRERGMQVALKTLLRLDTENLYFFKNEFRSLHDLVHPNLCAFMELIKDEKAWFFTMELIAGSDFLSHVKNDRMGGKGIAPMKNAQVDFRQLSDKADAEHRETEIAESGNLLFDEKLLRRSLAGLCHGLNALHSVGKVHRDIKPSNVMVTDESRTVLLDFGLVAEKEIIEQTELKTIVGSAAYMAPEQAYADIVGPEADMYSLGVMLYEAFTRRLPFDGPSAKIMMEKQLSDPLRPSMLCPGLPADLECLCMDLLRRDPENRPTAMDVLEIIDDDEKKDSDFSITSRITFYPQDSVFVGRRTELEHLKSAYHEANEEHVFKAVVIEGVSGVGKSALVARFAQRLGSIDPRTVILKGRCYERESAPYKAFDGVVDSLVRFTNGLSPEDAQNITPKNAELLLRLFPTLVRSKVFADVTLSPVELEDARELQNRSFESFGDLLLQVTRKQPLVVIIDDMQWADLDSLCLLKQIVSKESAPPLFLILLSRRAEEMEDSFLVWDDVLPQGYTLVHLDSLDRSDSEALARIYIDRESDSHGIIAESIAAEAAGHPLYIVELVRHIAAGGEEWKNVRLDEVIWGRVKTLPNAQKRMLRIICVAGTPMERGDLQALVGTSSEEYFRSITELRAAKLIRSRGPRNEHLIEPYHDRVREAVVAHDLSVSESTEIHLNIGRFFLKNYSESKLHENIFFVVQHLFSGSELITDENEKQRLAELLFWAGKKALASSAFVSSLIYFRESIALFSDESWNDKYGVMFELYCLAAHSAYITGDFALTKELVSIAKSRAVSNLDKAKIDETYILSLIADGRPLEALDEAIEIIGALGVKLPANPTKLSVLVHMLGTYLRLLTKTHESLLRLPKNKNQQILSAKVLMAAITTVTYTYRPNLNAIMAFKTVALSLKHGIDITSAYAFFAWGFVNCVFLKNYKTAHKYGLISLDMVKLFRDNGNSVKAIVSFAACVQHWVEPINNTLESLRRGHNMANGIGDLQYLAWSGTVYCIHSFFAGEPLDKLEEKFEYYGQEIEHKNLFLQYYGNRIYYQTTLNLRGLTSNPTRLVGSAYNENTMVPCHHKDNQGNNLFSYHCCRLLLNVYFNDYREACGSALEAKKYAGFAHGTYRVALLPFYESLACLKCIDQADPDDRREILRRVRRNQREYKKTAVHSPVNHSHKYKIVEAELLRVIGQIRESKALYDEAIHGAVEQGFTQDAALACEFAADFSRELGDENETREYARDALAHYEKWGAFAKVEHVKEKFGIK